MFCLSLRLLDVPPCSLILSDAYCTSLFPIKFYTTVFSIPRRLLESSAEARGQVKKKMSKEQSVEEAKPEENSGVFLGSV